MNTRVRCACGFLTVRASASAGDFSHSALTVVGTVHSGAAGGDFRPLDCSWKHLLLPQCRAEAVPVGHVPVVSRRAQLAGGRGPAGDGEWSREQEVSAGGLGLALGRTTEALLMPASSSARPHGDKEKRNRH